jgi:DHA1 family bicyclomycin/chloramphenicol resistance-like MFS transporter
VGRPRGTSGIGPLLLVTLALLSALAPFSIDMYLPGLPALAVDLGTDAARVQLTLTGFMVGLAIGQLVIGPLSDRWGRRRPLLVGTTVCVLSGVGCATAPSIELLVVTRFWQGFAGAAGIVIARAVVADLTTGRTAARAFSIMMTAAGLGPILAPLLGGAVLLVGDWRAVFWVLTAITALMWLGALLVVPETLRPEDRHGGGLAALRSNAGYVLRNRRFVGYALTLAASFGALFSYISASSFVLQNVVGLSVGWFSVTFALNAFGLVAATAVNARLVRRHSPRRLLAGGVAVQLTASAGLLVAGLAGATGPEVVLPLLFVASSCLGFTFGNATALATGEVRRAAGTGSAVIGTAQYAVGALVTPLVGLAGERAMLPMALTMVGASAVAAAALGLLTGRRGGQLRTR